MLMPIEVFNAEGDPVEGVLAPDEAKALQEQLDANKAELEKLRNKDYNFKKLRDMTDAERDALTAKEKALIEQQEKLGEEQRSFREGFINDVKEDVMLSLSGEDEELQKKIKLHYDRIKDSEKAQTRTEITKLMKEAYLLATGGKSASNSFNAAINISGESPKVEKKELGPEAKSIAGNLGITDEDLKKYSK